MNKRNAKYTEHATYQITGDSLSLLVQYKVVSKIFWTGAAIYTAVVVV